jgi:metallo-beta-lactamase class B
MVYLYTFWIEEKMAIKLLTLLLFIPAVLICQSNSPVELSKIGDSVWVHTTHKILGQYNVPSNGLIIQTSAGLILVDTPWDDSLTISLLETTKTHFNQPIVIAVITHAHIDRIGGIKTLRKSGIRVVSLPLVCQKAKESGYPEPDLLQSADTVLNIGNEKLEIFYPGPGHTLDNIVVWLPRQKVLFGGCLVKSERTTDLGNIEEANLQEWPKSIRTVMEKFKTARVIVPGHGTCGDFHLLQHTLDLLPVKQDK